MVGEQIEIRPDDCCHAVSLQPGQAARRAIPEESVMHQDGIGLPLARPPEQLEAGRDTGDHSPDRRGSLDLQAVGAEVRGLVDRQVGLEIGDQIVPLDGSSAGGRGRAQLGSSSILGLSFGPGGDLWSPLPRADADSSVVHDYRPDHAFRAADRRSPSLRSRRDRSRVSP